MTERLPLRHRLFAAIAGTVFFSLLLASTLYWFVNQHLESMILGIFMRAELEAVLPHLDENPQLRQLSPDATLVVVTEDGDVPKVLRDLPPGRTHDVAVRGSRYDVLRENIDGRTVWLMFDIDSVEDLEAQLVLMLVLLVVVMTALSSWLSYRLSQRLARPVDMLASRLANMSPQRPERSLSEEFAGEEVERIARAFDSYQERLAGFVEREQAFTAAASHELRTPLAVILGASELLEGGERTPREKKALARIHRASHEMMEFIDALLSLSREEAGAGDFSSEARVDEITRRLCEEFKETLHRDVRIEFRCECPEPIRVAAPPSLVVITIGNLIRNAIQNTREGSIDIRAEGRSVIVRDTGRGMSAEVQAQVFDRHFSASGSSGMGLYLVKRIADRYGWQVHVSSQEGKGTTVALTFP